MSFQAQGAAADEEESEDDIDMGAAILNFYCTLVDLLGRCAPEAATIAQGKNECVRARAILRSLVPLDDLLGALSLRFTLQTPRKGESGRCACSLGDSHELSFGRSAGRFDFKGKGYVLFPLNVAVKISCQT